MNQTLFSGLSLRPELLNNLSTLGYAEMTPIQASSLPPILSGKDVIAQGKTGSGKTAAFGLGILNNLDVSDYHSQSLVLCPTRELADQVAKEIRRLARGVPNVKVLTLCGGVPIGPQIGSLQRGAHIIVGTPGRIEAHMDKNRIDFDYLKTLVLDEADRMLDMGFQEALERLIAQLPQHRQTLLFSATFNDETQSIAAGIMLQPIQVKVESMHDRISIRQHFFAVTDVAQRRESLQLLLLHYQPESAIIFCNTKKEVNEIVEQLLSENFSVMALHGDLEQRDRDETLVRFSNKSVCVLVATDLAARGLDIEELDLVINYHVARDLEIYTHRIGRTGRAQETGMACSLFNKKEQHKIGLLEKYLGHVIVAEPLPANDTLQQKPSKPKMQTIQINGGRKQKIRPGDILGALTGEQGIEGKQVGKIDVFDRCAFVAVENHVIKQAVDKISRSGLKGRRYKARWIKHY